ncbi:MAG: 3D domain-containing protein [Negativicutes bacterium]|nr:3D domain-containing protein [Negativicutes bacterium]
MSKLKKLIVVVLIIFGIGFYQTAPVYASFFLFNIIHDIFSGGHKEAKPPPETHPGGNAVSVVKFGMKNSQVIAIQQDLIKANYLSGNADGVFGYKTLQAVKEFQSDSGLEADGVVGSRTWGALKNFHGTKPKSPPRKPTYRSPQTSDGTPSYLYTLPMLVTAYTRYDEGCTDYTYRGTYLRRGLCAVDPDVIPLGTKLYIPGYGEAIADDIGGAIIGNHIDLAMDSLDEAFDWGAKNVTIYVLPKN